MQYYYSVSTLDCDGSVAAGPPEVKHVPRWVKAIVVVGAILCAVQMLGIGNVLSDAMKKNRAEKAFQERQYAQAVELYQDLCDRYPTEIVFLKRLAFCHYRVGQYEDAIDTFQRLSGVKMSSRDVTEINAAISDIATKLNGNGK